MIHVCATLQIGGDITKILLITPGVMSAHYSIEYRTHFTNWHITTVGAIGATEQLFFVQLGTLYAAFNEKSNEALQASLPFELPGGIQMSIADTVVLFAALTGFHYNLTNIYSGMVEAKDKLYALGCILPYAQFFVMLYFSSYSRFFALNSYYFLCMNGLYLTYVTGIFNLNSTGGMRFNYLYYEPFLYGLILYFDKTLPKNSENDQIIFAAYCFYTLQIFIKYIIFMTSVINQLTSYLNIPFIRVKDKKQTKQE